MKSTTATLSGCETGSSKIRPVVLLIVCTMVLFPFSVTFGSPQSKAPVTVSIPIPGADPIVFNAVFLGIDGTRMFQSKLIRLGSRKENNSNYKTRRVDTLLAGGFVGDRKGKPEWLYYLSTTEVQKRQWRAFMMEEGSGADGESSWRKRSTPFEPTTAQPDDQEPQTAITIAEIYLFIEALNTWMLSQHRADLPVYEGALAFARLPTETEWAFAARGGLASLESDYDLFNQPHPYGDAILEHEWLSGSSGNRVQSVGTRKPNALGMYDMLGNVQEYTINLFGPEYQQGRFGQHAIRGGKYNDYLDKVSVANRTEALFYYDGTLVRDRLVGFRLALGTRVSSVDGDAEKFDRAFKSYARENPLPYPGPTGAMSPASQATQDAVRLLQRENEQLRRDNIRLAQELDGLQSQALVGMPKVDAEADEEKLREANRRIEGLVHEGVRLKVDLASSVAHCRELDDRLQTLEIDYTQLEENLVQAAAMKRSSSAPEVDLFDPHGQISRCMAHSGSNSEERKYIKARYERLSKKIGELKENLAQSLLSKQRLSIENRELQGTIILTRQEVSDLTSARDRLTDQVARLEKDNGVLGGLRDRLIADLVGKNGLVADKEKELGYARHRIAIRDQEIVKNLGRVYSAERRFVEALMRSASVSAYLGFRSLVHAEAILALPKSPARDRRYRQRREEGQQMIYDYWRRVVEIAQDTDPSMFDPVKQELADWLRVREEPGKAGRQRRSLELIARHVSMVRAGNVIRPQDLVESFLRQPELR